VVEYLLRSARDPSSNPSTTKKKKKKKGYPQSFGSAIVLVVPISPSSSPREHSQASVLFVCWGSSFPVWHDIQPLSPRGHCPPSCALTSLDTWHVLRVSQGHPLSTAAPPQHLTAPVVTTVLGQVCALPVWRVTSSFLVVFSVSLVKVQQQNRF
jgi:hypothetical protein